MLMPDPQRSLLIACEILFREACFCAARSRNCIDIVFLPKGLHDLGEKGMAARLQEELDKVDRQRYGAVLLGYGLCNNGIRGLKSNLPLVIPRAHDCITIMLGSKERYADYFEKNPGTYFKSTGWVERDASQTEQSVTARLGMNKTYQEYVQTYGEENARYLMETMNDWLKNYKKLAYIDTHVGDFVHYKQLTKQQAQEKGWEYEELKGDVGLLQRLLDGDWNDKDFLIIPPGKSPSPSYNESVIRIQ
ncbi:MAG: DUF1638 domain-containing protein [Chitinivibrionales bacterium]|nr:DUF1638 domain-containing protein [Chitinivibrionales bacterium]